MKVQNNDHDGDYSESDDSEPSSDDSDQLESGNDPILGEGGVKIYPYYVEHFTYRMEDFIDVIEDHFYPDYLYWDEKEQKVINDLLDLASSDLPILMDKDFQKNQKHKPPSLETLGAWGNRSSDLRSSSSG